MEGARLARIVEAKDATPEELAIPFCNSGLMAAGAATLIDLLKAEVGNDNASGEYYLTDVPALAAARGLTATAIACDEAETLGINTAPNWPGPRPFPAGTARRGDGERRHADRARNRLLRP